VYATGNKNICPYLRTLILNRVRKETGIFLSLIHVPEMLFLIACSDSGVQISFHRKNFHSFVLFNELLYNF
jgi:hypothetical protein